MAEIFHHTHASGSRPHAKRNEQAGRREFVVFVMREPRAASRATVRAVGLYELPPDVSMSAALSLAREDGEGPIPAMDGRNARLCVLPASFVSAELYEAARRAELDRQQDRAERAAGTQ